MIVIGLTGSIGMGKTTVAQMFERLGVPALDSDLVVHEILKIPGIIKRVGALFPAALKKNILDRYELGKAVFAQPEKLQKLEAIIHPKVWQAQREFIKKQSRLGAKAVLFDIPLLYETGAEARMDYVIVATAPAAIQKARTMKRPGMTEEKFKRILKRQMPDSQKRKRADFIVHTGEGRAKSLKEVKAILKKILP